jgi:hypothetical protein
LSRIIIVIVVIRNRDTAIWPVQKLDVQETAIADGQFSESPFVGGQTVFGKELVGAVECGDFAFRARELVTVASVIAGQAAPQVRREDAPVLWIFHRIARLDIDRLDIELHIDRAVVDPWDHPLEGLGVSQEVRP